MQFLSRKGWLMGKQNHASASESLRWWPDRLYATRLYWRSHKSSVGSENTLQGKNTVSVIKFVHTFCSQISYHRDVCGDLISQFKNIYYYFQCKIHRCLDKFFKLTSQTLRNDIPCEIRFVFSMVYPFLVNMISFKSKSLLVYTI